MPKQVNTKTLMMFALTVVAVGIGVALTLGSAAWAWGWTLGVLWNTANLYLLIRLAGLMFAAQEGRSTKKPLLFLILAKFGLLYPIGIAILYKRWCLPEAFAAGFTAILILMIGRLAWPAWRGQLNA